MTGLVVRVVAGGRDFGEPYRRLGPGQYEPKPTGLAERERAWAFEVFRRAQARKPVQRGFHGACRDNKGKPVGADALFEAWCLRTGVQSVGYPAAFGALGPLAGPTRNVCMIADVRDLCDLAESEFIALPGGTGTRGALELARKAGLACFDLTAKGPR